VAAPSQVIEFGPPDTGAVVDAIVALTRAQSGWITLLPGVHPDDAPPPRSLFEAVFSGGGPPVPVCTWVAPDPKQKPPHAEIGIMHKSGPKAQRRLIEKGLEVPANWVVLADHPRRGLVVAVHPDASPAAALDWLLRAAAILTRIPLTGSWQASVHGRA
jgi:hypothetical protein